MRSWSPATAPTAARASSYLPPKVHLISHVHPKGALYEPAPPRRASRGPARKKGIACRGWSSGPTIPNQPWTELKFDQFGLHATLAVKTIKALYYKAGGDRLLKIVLVHDLEGKRPDQMFYCTKLDWTARQILSAYSYRWAIECTFENCKQFLGLEDPANRLAKWSLFTINCGVAMSRGLTYSRSVRPEFRSSPREWSRIMPGPAPLDQPTFPAEFLDECRSLVRRRTVPHAQHQRARLVLLLHESPDLSNVAAGALVDLHANSVRLWRHRWACGNFSLADQSGPRAQARFFPLATRPSSRRSPVRPSARPSCP